MDGDKPVLPVGESRGLTPGERALARSVFGNSVNYDDVRIVNGKEGLGWDVANVLGSVFGAKNTQTRPQVVGNTIYYPKDQYSDDFSTSGGDHTFIHEMAHVWQRQNNMVATAARTARDVVTSGLKYDETYSYQLQAGRDLGNYNLEQQADIIADFYSWRKAQQDPKREASLAEDPDGSNYVEKVSKFLQQVPEGSSWRRLMLKNAAVDVGADGKITLNQEKYAHLIEAQKQTQAEDRQHDAVRQGVMQNFLDNPQYLNPVQGATRGIIDATINAVPAAISAIRKFTIG
ncbi:MAG: hypothetical protein ACAH80_07460 [Alphaproteobacteria bacterium]